MADLPQGLLTELDAVNIMLGTIGEAPINSLSPDVLPADIQAARNILNEQSRNVQEKGWRFNTENEVEFIRDQNNGVSLGQNVLKFKQSAIQQDAQVDLVQRGLKVYDRKNHTYVLKINPKLDVTYFLSWDELPQAARQYITVKAARIFQTRSVGSDTLKQFTDQDEFEAKVAFEEAEGETAEFNIFNNYDVGSILLRQK